MQSEGEIDTCNEITLDKLKSNLSDVGLPSDSEFIRVSYVMNCCKSYDEIFEYAKKVNFSNVLFIDDEGDLTVYSQRLDMIDVIVSKSLMVIFHTRPNTSAKFG